MTFHEKSTAIVCGNTTDGTFLAMAGISTGSMTPDDAVSQINKILAIAGKALANDTNVKRIKTEEAVSS